jgi:hypothetical protein
LRASNNSATRGEAARDVLSLGRLTRDLGEDVAGASSSSSVIDDDVGADRQDVVRVVTTAALELAGSALVSRVADHDDVRADLCVAALHDDLAADRPVTSSTCVGDGDTFDDVLEADLATDFGQDRHREGVPLGKDRARRRRVLAIFERGSARRR